MVRTKLNAVKKMGEGNTAGDDTWLCYQLGHRLLDCLMDEDVAEGHKQVERARNERIDIEKMLLYELDNRANVLRRVEKEGICHHLDLVLQLLKFLVAKKEAGIEPINADQTGTSRQEGPVLRGDTSDASPSADSGDKPSGVAAITRPAKRARSA